MKNPCYLVQTDTTAGFLCKDSKKINRLKGRDENTPCLLCISDYEVLKQETRVPNKHKNFIRRAKQTSFIFSNTRSFRVVKDPIHLKFIQKFKKIYSSSANLSKNKFDLSYALKKADIVVEDERGFFEAKPSSIIRISRTKKRKIR